MGKQAMLSVDLNNVTSDQRRKFYDKLKDLDWIKVQKLTTLWRASFASNASESSVISTTKSDVKTSANYASIIDYDAAVHVGDSAPTEF